MDFFLPVPASRFLGPGQRLCVVRFFFFFFLKFFFNGACLYNFFLCDWYAELSFGGGWVVWEGK